MTTNNKKAIQTLFFTGFLLILGTAPSLAVTIPVNTAIDVIDPTDGKCALREAVIAANDDVSFGGTPGECPAGDGADQITLGPATYPLTIPGTGEDDAGTGDLDIKNPVTLTCSGGAENCAIFGNTLDRVIDVKSSAGTVSITGLTIGGGYAGDNPYDGGGIYNAAFLTLSDVSISGNTALDVGGGIYNEGTLQLFDSRVTKNLAPNAGGGIYTGFHSTLDIDSSVIKFNNAYGDFRDGGGIYVDRGFLTITDSSISFNNAEGSGGGIYHASDSESTITSSTIAGNEAGGDGGGILHGWAGKHHLRNVTLSGNTAGGVGGGIVTTNLTQALSLNQVTLSNNSAGSGGEGIWIDNVNNTDVTTANTLFADPCGGGGETSFTSLGGNMESPGNTCNLQHLTDQVNILASELALGSLSNNGGPTLTHYLGDLSFAIDGGYNLACQPMDQRGAARPQNGDEIDIAICDVGAVEVIPCPFSETVVLENITITGTQTYEACGQIQTGSGLSIASNAVATFAAGESVALGAGFSVHQGGQLAIAIDPLVGQRP